MAKICRKYAPEFFHQTFFFKDPSHGHFCYFKLKRFLSHSPSSLYMVKYGQYGQYLKSPFEILNTWKQ